MPVNPVLFNPRHFFLLAPEISLAVWGLVVLLADVMVFRLRTPEERRAAVGRLALVGAVVSLFVSLLPLMLRTNPDLPAWMNLAKIDYLSDPDPVLFFGTIASDLMSETFNVLFAGLFVLIVWMSPTWSFTEEWGEYYALLFWSTVGMMLLTASEELLTLFLTLEMMTICLYLATAFEKTKRRSAEGGLKYFVYGSVSSALFLFGLSLLYGLTGSTQFFAIRQVLTSASGSADGLTGNVVGATALLLMLVGFGFKVAAVPFHMWAPDAYEGAPAPVTAWIATGSKIASFVALMKVLLNALGAWSTGQQSVAGPGWIGVVAVLAATSMTYGNFAALAQTNLKRMLAYSSIAHAGYMLVGVAAAAISVKLAASAGAVLFYLLVYALANIGAFAVAAWLARDKGTDEISDLDGLARRFPFLATCILVLMLSLIGMPPLAGFFGKLYMFMEALDEGRGLRGAHMTLLWLVALGLLNSVVSAFYYVRVLKAMFLREPSGPEMKPPPRSVATAIVLATVVTVILGVYPAPAMSMMRSLAVPMLSESSLIGRDGVTRPEKPGPPGYQGPTPEQRAMLHAVGPSGPTRPITAGPPPLPSLRVIPPAPKSKGDSVPQSKPQAKSDSVPQSKPQAK